jgi:hypothetical protein
MSYGLNIRNGSGLLVISSDASGLCCVGKGVLQGSVVQASGTATSSSPGRRAGYSVYRIYHPTEIIVAMDLPINTRVCILSITQPFAGAWDVTMHCGDAGDGYGMSGSQYQIDIWGFGFSPGVLGGYGMAIFKANGALSYDFSRNNCLFPRSFGISSGNSGVSIASLARPVVLGNPSSRYGDSSFLSGNRYEYRTSRNGWKRVSATQVNEEPITTQNYQYFSTEPVDSGASFEYGLAPCFSIEGSTLP